MKTAVLSYISTGGQGGDFLGARGQLHLGLLCLGVVGDDSGIVLGGLSQLTPVTRLLQTEHNGALKHGAPWEHIVNINLGLLAAVHKLGCVGMSSSPHFINQ